MCAYSVKSFQNPNLCIYSGIKNKDSKTNHCTLPVCEFLPKQSYQKTQKFTQTKQHLTLSASSRQDNSNVCSRVPMCRDDDCGCPFHCNFANIIPKVGLLWLLTIYFNASVAEIIVLNLALISFNVILNTV